MKKLSIVLCLMILSIALFNLRVYAAFIYDITEFEQFDGTDTFTDTFSDGVEPPSGSISGTDYWTFGTFAPNRESGGLLELNSADGIIDIDEVIDREINADLIDSTFFFSSGTGGHVLGKFEANDSFWSDSFFGIWIFNFASGGGDPVTEDEAFMGIFVDASGSIFAEWGDESSDNEQDITSALGANTFITMKLKIDTLNMVTAMWDYGSDGTFDLTQSIFTTLSFTPGDPDDIYTGAFGAGEPIPEPATIALLGIGLAGLGGRYLRRRRLISTK